MDPQQRHVLETSYEALFNAGALLLCFNDVVCFCYEMYACLPAAYTYIINYYIIHRSIYVYCFYIYIYICDMDKWVK